MTHQELLELGFEIYGEHENDPFYKIVFLPPLKFNVDSLSGYLNENVFHLYGNSTKYTKKHDLKKIIDAVGSKNIYKQR